MKRNLIDEYVLSIHPLVLGSGRHLFSDRSPFARLQLIDSKTITIGVIIATYRSGARTAVKSSWPPPLPRELTVSSASPGSG